MGPSDTPPETNDRELLAAHVAGDPHAFETLFSRHRDRLWAVALRTTSDPEEASDGLQDAMISAFRNAGSYRGEAAVTTWLHRVVVNACLDRLRRKRSRPTVPLPGTDAETGRDNLPDPRDDIGSLELGLEIEKALATLPEEQRAAIVLVDVEGYRVDEAAEMLGCPSGTIKSRCARGRAKLAAQLANLRSDPPDPGGNHAHGAPVLPQSRAPQGGDEDT